MTLFYCLRFETPPTWRARSPYLYLPETGCPSYTPRHGVPFSSPPTTRGAMVEVFEPESTRGTGLNPKLCPCYNPSARTAQKQLFCLHACRCYLAPAAVYLAVAQKPVWYVHLSSAQTLLKRNFVFWSVLARGFCFRCSLNWLLQVFIC
jgi:hypothetical protein